MGDNSVDDQQNLEECLEEQLSEYHNESDEEEVIIEEYYETYYIPSSLVLERDRQNVQNRNVLDTVSNECKINNQVSNASRKKHGQSNIKTITRIDEDTENVVILIRPRRRSVSPSEQKIISEDISIDSMEKEETNMHRQTCDQMLEKQDYFCENDKEYGMDNCQSQMSPKMYEQIIQCVSENTEFLADSPNINTLSNECIHHTENENLGLSVSNGNLSMEQLIPAKYNENEDQRDKSKQISQTGMISKYEYQGARPKTRNPTHQRSDRTIEHHVVLNNSNKELSNTCQPENITQKFSGHYGISQEASDKVKKLKEMGKYDDLVRTCNLQRNKGVVHDLVQKINMGNVNQEITEEDDALIWKLMQSLKEKAAENRNMNKMDKSDEDINLSDSMPKDKCDWSYEKATMSKDKYLSRRLQTKEKGQVKIITFVSPSKEKKEVNIQPLKVSKTLPFNVKHIFQQKMNELKNKERVCLTGGKELMFTKFNVDDPNVFQCPSTI